MTHGSGAIMQPMRRTGGEVHAVRPIGLANVAPYVRAMPEPLTINGSKTGPGRDCGLWPERASRATQRIAPTTSTSWRFEGGWGMLGVMATSPVNDPSPIPSAPIGDLDLDIDADDEEWERRLMALASTRIQAARARLERMGIIDADGRLVSSELPPDMLPDSDTTLETG